MPDTVIRALVTFSLIATGVLSVKYLLTGDIDYITLACLNMLMVIFWTKK